MIAADTSTWIALFEVAGGPDTELLERAIRERQTLMIPAVLTELLSDPLLGAEDAQTLGAVPVVELEPGYWHRAGLLRAKVLSMRRKARLGDALIAQSCIDRKIPLLTRDTDFQAFAEAAELKLVLQL
jgi:predicted nucleic acid-binding protein